MWMLLPAWMRYAVYGTVAALGIYAGIWIFGEKKYHEGMAYQKELSEKVAVKVQQGSVKVTERVITEYIPKVQYIEGKTKTIIEKVPIYVTKVDDSHCTVPSSFVWLWNNANQMQLPGNPVPVPTGTSFVVLSDIATQHTVEAGICLANEERIRATTKWLKEQKALYDGK